MTTTSEMSENGMDLASYARTERRIAQLTLVLGALAAIGAYFLYSGRIGVGVLIGAVLAWINFRWLESALNVVSRAASAQADAPKARVPLGSIFGLIGRYLLIGAVVCVIFISFGIPILSMLVGLCALGAATIGASLYEVFNAWD